MGSQHFIDGEEKDLCHFLRVDDERVRMIRECLSPDNWNFIKESVEKTLAYQNRSTYGRTREDIIVNARDHLQGCPNCLERYRKALQKSAYETVDVQITDLGVQDSFAERFHRYIRDTDKLGLLQKTD